MIVLGGSGCIMFSIVIRCVEVCVFFEGLELGKSKGGRE